MAVTPQTTLPSIIIDLVTRLDAESVMPNFEVLRDNLNSHAHTEYATLVEAQADADAAEAAAIASANTYTDSKVASSTGTFPVVTKTTSWSVTDADFVILADANSGSLTITMPTAVGRQGRMFVIKRINAGTNTVTLTTSSSQTIDGATSRVLNYQYECYIIISDNANWHVMAYSTIAAPVGLVSTKTGNYTLIITDDTILADATSGVITMTLPTAVGNTGKQYKLKRINTNGNSVVVATTSAQTIDGSTSRVLTNPYESITVISNGANWMAL